MTKKSKNFIISNGLPDNLKYLRKTAQNEPVSWGTREEANVFIESEAKKMLARVRKFFVTTEMIEVQ